MPDGLKHSGRKVTKLKQIQYSSYNEWQTVLVETWNNVSWVNLSYGRLQFAILYNPYPTAFPYGNDMVLHFYQQQESSTTKTVHKVINKGLKTYVQSLHTGENFH